MRLPDNCSIRPGIPGQHRSFWQKLEDREYIKFPGLEPDSYHIGLYHEGKLVGWAWLKHLSRVPYLGIAILKEYRRKSYGTSMIQCMVEKAKEVGAEKIEAGYLSGNPAGLFYKKLGFRIVATGETADKRVYYKAVRRIDYGL